MIDLQDMELKWKNEFTSVCTK